ncbi:DUF2000 domain-containing protein [Nocardiopsis ansamitocini]|uniref:DUF2000 domain-containing protein n=1 Tax=Nocardiopsis ansamitocini TaxID=1670832 RepID=A0A9W6P9P7_9ACTN|nr:DUF2000 domain-containing protein [Nocardiopsis ansamitocini]GLU50215.1 hypothetical protein Nans01_45660 [Nocardiopsis ansamitocini]
MSEQSSPAPVGFAPEEMLTAEPTRSARLKWVVVVDERLPAGRAANAVICVAAATSANVIGLLGQDVKDADGGTHPGLPWAGCSVLAAAGGRLAAIRARAAASAGVFVADMPGHAQRTRVYDDYLDQVARSGAEDLDYSAISLVGPRNRIDKLTKGLSLLP